MLKTPFTINYETMELVPPPGMETLAVKGEDMSTRIYFEVDKSKTRCDWDLSTGIWEVKYENFFGETGRQIMTDVKDEDGTLTMSFCIPGALTKEAGKVFIELCCMNVELDKHWHVSPYKAKIGKFFKVASITEDDPKYDAINQILAWFKKYPDPGEIKGQPLTVATEEIDAGNIVRFLQDGAEIGNITVLNGADGKSFTFDDLTPEQKEELRGPKGDPGDGIGEEISVDDLDEIMTL